MNLIISNNYFSALFQYFPINLYANKISIKKMKSLIFTIHLPDSEWQKSAIEFCTSHTKNLLTDDEISILFFKILPLKWPIIYANPELKNNLIKYAENLTNFDPCYLILFGLERIPNIPHILIRKDEFKQFLCEFIKTLIFDKKNLQKIILHCKENIDNFNHPNTKMVLKSYFKIQTILLNFLGFCPKELCDPIYYGNFYKMVIENIDENYEEFIKEIIEISLNFNKIDYFFLSLSENWNEILQNKLINLFKKNIDLNTDSLIFKLFEFLHIQDAHSDELINLFSNLALSLDSLTFRKIFESKHFTISDAKRVLKFLEKTVSEADKLKIFTICAEIFGEPSFSILAPISQHKCIFENIIWKLYLILIIKNRYYIHY